MDDSNYALLGITPLTSARVQRMIENDQRSIVGEEMPTSMDELLDTATKAIQDQFGYLEGDDTPLTVTMTKGQAKLMRTALASELNGLLKMASMVAAAQIARGKSINWKNESGPGPEELASRLADADDVLSGGLADTEAQTIEFTIPDSLEGTV